MKTFAPINIVVHYPKTEEGWRELRRRMAIVHADAVLNSISKLNCPASQKESRRSSTIRKHRSKPKKQQNQTKAMPSPRGRHSCLCRDSILEILLPGFEADHLSAALPILQAADGDAHLSGKGFLSQAERVSIFLNLSGLSAAEEAVIAIQ